MNKSRVQDNPDSVCVVCCRNVVIYSIGECDHPVCHDCATRMRVLCRQNECPICRRELPKVIFSRVRKPYADVANVVYTLQDRKYKVYFEDEGIQQAYNGLLELGCRMCKNKPVFSTFSQLKDHVRREHELHFCDLCVKHLMIFSCERKLYTRSDLARHRRQGDPDDTSHRGHPLCEFCDERYLDSDELFRHLRKDHFFCHFCDANGLHHYYCDYEYLREHFRVEHFLCEEGDCRGERFTTVFNSEIDIKAHRATVHNKGMTKSQSKQARTLELEFTIAPRGMAAASSSGSGSATLTNGRPGHENVTFNDGDPHRRRTAREEYAAAQGMDISQTIGKRPDDQQRGSSARGNNHQRHGYDENRTRMPMPRRGYDDLPAVSIPVAPNLDVSSRSDFPTLGNSRPATAVMAQQPTRRLGAASSAPATPPTADHGHNNAALNSDTLARKLAKINRFTVGNAEMGAVDEFPALNPVKAPAPSTQRAAQQPPSFFSSAKSSGRGSAKPGLWASSSGSATLSVTSSQAPAVADERRGKNMLTLKLNSQEEFPGLVENRRSRPQPQPAPIQRQAPNVCIQLSHKQTRAQAANANQTARRNSDASTSTTNSQREMWRPANAREGEPRVTSMSASQNITFINPPGGATTTNSSKSRRRRGSDESPPSEEAFPKLSGNDVDGLADGGWYMLKKSGKSTKLDSPPEEHRPTEFVADTEADFPVLEKKSGRMLRPGFVGVARQPVPVSTNVAWKKGAETTATSSTLEESPPETKSKAKKKKSKQPVVAASNNSGENMVKVTGGSNEKPTNKSDKSNNSSKVVSDSSCNGVSTSTKGASKKEKDDREKKEKDDREKKQSSATKKTENSAEKKSENLTATKKNENQATSKKTENSRKSDDSTSAKKKDNTSGKRTEDSNAKKNDDANAKKNEDANVKKNENSTSGKKASKRTELNVASLAPSAEEQEHSATIEILNSETDFPSLSSSLKPVAAPPGFNGVSNKSSVAPPPGFLSPLTSSAVISSSATYTTNPPPGFRMPAAQSPTSPTSVTFTSSSGQNYAILTPPAYDPPDQFPARNQDLTGKLRGMLEAGSGGEGGEDKFGTFKLLSCQFRQGVTSATDYYQQCVHLIGRDDFQSVFPELLVLLPDIGKQKELLDAHKTYASSDKKTIDPFLICASCQQVLIGKDFRTHENSHNLIADFPALDDRLQQPLSSHVSWVKRS